MPGMSPNIERTQVVAPADGETLLWAVDERDARTLGPGLLNGGHNLRFTNGVPETRKGVAKPGWANLTSPTIGVQPLGTPYGSGVFRDPNSLEWQFVAAGGYVFRTRPGNNNVTVPLPPGVAILGPCKFVQAFDRLFLFRGRYLAPLLLTDYDTGFLDLLPQYNAATRYNAAVVATGQPADETAYGPFLSITSLTRSGGTATAVTASLHGYVTGADVTIQGATPAGYNGRVNITVTDDYSFTYTVAAGLTTPATGTITVSNMAYYWKALGSQVTLLSLVASGTTATATTTAAHGFGAGQYVTITGATPAGLNGTWPIDSVTTTTFVWTLPTGVPGGSASGTIKAQTSVTFAGQTPDSNPEAWQRSYNILPNADTALFTDNLLLVPTAYQPASVDNYASFNGGQYLKVDYIVATNFQDYLHFQFSNEFRINQGGDDEIVDLFKFGTGSVIVLKTKSWGVLSALGATLGDVTLDMRSTDYGCVGRNAWTVVGSNAYFLSPTFGIVVIRQSDLGTMLSVNVPLSAPIQPTMDLIDWKRGTQCRMSHWDNKLYLSVPLNTGGPAILVYDFVASVRMGNNVWESGVMTQGWTGRDTGSALTVVEFHRLTLNGEERHFFLDAQGFVNLMEENERGDEVPAVLGAAHPLALGWEEIATYALSRAYDPSLKGQVRPVETAFSVATWNACYTCNVVFSGVNVKTALVVNKTRSSTAYDRPFDAPAWNANNVNTDWGRAYRGDYAVRVPAGGFYFDPAGVVLDQFQESLDTRRAAGRQNKDFQLEFLSSTGRVRLVGQRVSAVPGRNRRGVQT